MARQFYVSHLPYQRDMFGSCNRTIQIVGDESSIKDLNVALLSILSHGKYEPLSPFEEDVLSDLYNSLCLFNSKK